MTIKKPYYEARNEYQILEELRISAAKRGDLTEAKVWSDWMLRLEKQAALGQLDYSVKDSLLEEQKARRETQMKNVEAFLNKMKKAYAN